MNERVKLKTQNGNEDEEKEKKIFSEKKKLNINLQSIKEGRFRRSKYDLKIHTFGDRFPRQSSIKTLKKAFRVFFSYNFFSLK